MDFHSISFSFSPVWTTHWVSVSHPVRTSPVLSGCNMNWGQRQWWSRSFATAIKSTWVPPLSEMSLPCHTMFRPHWNLQDTIPFWVKITRSWKIAGHCNGCFRCLEAVPGARRGAAYFYLISCDLLLSPRNHLFRMTDRTYLPKCIFTLLTKNALNVTMT